MLRQMVTNFAPKNYHRLYIKFKRYHFAANLSGSLHLIILDSLLSVSAHKLKKVTLFSAFCPEAISSKKLPFSLLFNSL